MKGKGPGISESLARTVEEVASEVLGLARGRVHGELRREETAGWDSFNHLLLISRLEEACGVSFTMAEVQAVGTLSDLKRLIAEKVVRAAGSS